MRAKHRRKTREVAIDSGNKSLKRIEIIENTTENHCFDSEVWVSYIAVRFGGGSFGSELPDLLPSNTWQPHKYFSNKNKEKRVFFL